MKPIYWRRFILLDKEKEPALIRLLNEKGLTRDDLFLILQTIAMNEKGGPRK